MFLDTGFTYKRMALKTSIGVNGYCWKILLENTNVIMKCYYKCEQTKSAVTYGN